MATLNFEDLKIIASALNALENKLSTVENADATNTTTLKAAADKQKHIAQIKHVSDKISEIMRGDE